MAASYGRLEVVQLLVEFKAPIDAQDDKGYTALHYAAQNNRRDIVEYLIGKRANHLILNKDGLKAFEIAPEPLNNDLIEFVIRDFMMACESDGNIEPPILTPGQCVFCQAALPVLAFKPCPHILLCDKCYINHKEILKVCPICRKNLKTVEILNPPQEPEPIEEDPPEEEETKPEPAQEIEEEEEPDDETPEVGASTEGETTTDTYATD